jgi:cytochrome c oxidase subunit 3
MRKMSAVARHEGNHEFHLVDPSPWPAAGAAAAFLLTFGAVVFMHPDMFGEGAEETIAGLGALLILPGVFLVLLTMFLWWRDAVREATFEGHHTPIVQLGMRYGMALFIASEVMFFVAFFWAFFNSSLYPKLEPFVWPPEGVVPLPPLGVPLMNTVILLTSGVTVTWAHHALREGQLRHVINLLILTIALGALFTGLQAYESIHAAFKFTDGIYSSTFYMATGFHGFHVIIGIVFLTVTLFRAMKGHFRPDHHFGFEAAAWYWYFVDAVWLFLFSSIYLWGS